MDRTLLRVASACLLLKALSLLSHRGCVCGFVGLCYPAENAVVVVYSLTTFGMQLSTS